MRLQCVTTQKAVTLYCLQEKFISCTYYYSLIMTVVSHCRTINCIPQKMDLIQLTPLKAIHLFFDHYFNFQHGNHISKMGSSCVSSCKGYADIPTLFEPQSEVPTPWTQPYQQIQQSMNIFVSFLSGEGYRNTNL